MIDAQRLRDRMAEMDISQAELARRVGVKQQSIGRMVSGDALGSRFLHQVARELRTTPAYLSGETDDPVADGPDLPEFSADEREAIELLRGLEPKDRAAVMQLIRTIASSAPSSMVQFQRPRFKGK